LTNKFIGDPHVLFCPDQGSENIGESLGTLDAKGLNALARCTYFYRQLDARRSADALKGRFGSLGYNAGRDQTSDVAVAGSTDDDKPVRAIVADRNFIGYRNGATTESTIRTNHNGDTINILFEDGHVLSILNQNPETPNDLRLDMSSATPSTGTNGTLEEESDRVWVLYDEY
jgi:prepilin-type processing-associated H-X9-DG protein